MMKRILPLALVLVLLLSGCNLVMRFINPGAFKEPEYKLPKLTRGIEYAPGDESRTVTEVYADMKLELPEGVGLIDYGTDEFIVWAGRFENDARNPIESTVYYYDGEEEIRSVSVIFSAYGVGGKDAPHGDGYQAENIYITVGEEEPMTKTERVAAAEEAIKTVLNNYRIYPGWNKPAAVSGGGSGAMPGFLTAAFEYLMSRFGPLGPFIALLIILLVLYWTFFRWYKLALLNKYGFKVMGIPAKFTMACYFLAIGLPLFLGVGNDPISTAATGYNDAQKLLLLLAIGAAGILWQAINCLIKTGNLFLVIFHIALMYIVCFFMGYLFVGYVALLIILRFFVGLTKRDSYKCPKCGARVDSTGDCPNCGQRLA